MTWLITAVAIVAGLAFVATANTWWAGKQRRNYLRAEYGDDPALAQRLIDKEIWAGMTDRQLIDSQGDPRDKELTHADGKSFETYKYDKLGDKYRLRVYLENCLVTRWEKDP